MRKEFRYLFFSIGLCLFLIFSIGSTGSRQACGAFAQEGTARIVLLRGEAWILRGPQRVLAGLGTMLFAGDQLVTANGELRIEFGSGDTLTLYPNTNVIITASDGRRTILELLVGRVRSIVRGLRNDRIKQEFYTKPVVILVRGTEYTVKTDEASDVEVQVQEGKVLVGKRKDREFSKTLDGFRELGADQSIRFIFKEGVFK